MDVKHIAGRAGIIILIICGLVAGWNILGLFAPNLGTPGQLLASTADRLKSEGWKSYVNEIINLPGIVFDEDEKREMIESNAPKLFWPDDRPGPTLKARTLTNLIVLLIVIVPAVMLIVISRKKSPGQADVDNSSPEPTEED